MTQTKTNDPATPSQQRTVLLAVDLKNSVLAEVDAGNTNRIAYSPYGHQSAQQEVASQLGFNGERRETTPGWYFLGNGYRVYNPRLMRFHSPDNMSPFGKGGLNAYMYCGGEPVMNSDPTGHFFFRFFRRVIPTVVVATAAQYSDRIAPLPPMLQASPTATSTAGAPVAYLFPAKATTAPKTGKGAFISYSDNNVSSVGTATTGGPRQPKQQTNYEARRKEVSASARDQIRKEADYRSKQNEKNGR
ncbi:RHS repeat-associated core domain-containing protein [Pseudomonas sp. Z1-12]|uniref:RHS repeat-associated core domain-containing protein n=1 Tax=Pseudomonas sp. Z1-12 TaxID=2817408 RepID=UPI003DA918A3